MKLRIIPILILLHLNLYSQTDCDTLINKTDYKKLVYLVNECDGEVTEYQNKINLLEQKLFQQQQRIKFLEELVINRHKFNLKKCPKLSKKSKRKPKFRTI